jgi:WD40 repeat protein
VTDWTLDAGPRSGRIAWLDEERALLTARWLGQTRLITDARSGASTPLTLAPKQAGLPTAQALSPDRTRLLVSSTSGRTLLWDLGEAALWASVGDGRSPVLHAAFAPDGSTFVTTQADGRVLLRPLDIEGAARRALPEVVAVP